MGQLSLNLCAWSLCSATREWKLLSRVQLFATPWTNTVPGILQARTLSLLQGIFPTQGSNPNLPHCRWILYQLSHQESPRILEWVAYPFSSRSLWHRNQTGVSCIAGRCLTNWATREALNSARICSQEKLSKSVLKSILQPLKYYVWVAGKEWFLCFSFIYF